MTCVIKLDILYLTMKKKITKFVKAIGEWYPTYPNSQVKISLVQDSEILFRVTIWGEDDFGLEKEFLSYAEAKTCYNNLAIPASVPALIKLGFVQS